MNHRISFGRKAVLVAAACIVAAPAIAANLGRVLVGQSGPVTYATGGIGKEEQATMHRMAAKYPVRIAFSVYRDGEFVADVPVVIAKQDGRNVLYLAKAGPLLDVKLPVGAYTIAARYAGRKETRDITVDGETSSNVYFNWKTRQGA